MNGWGAGTYTGALRLPADVGAGYQVGFEAFGCVEGALAVLARADELVLDLVEVVHRIEDRVWHDSGRGLHASMGSVGVFVDGTSGFWDRCAISRGGAFEVRVTAVGRAGDNGVCGVVGEAGEVALRGIGFFFLWRE